MTTADGRCRFAIGCADVQLEYRRPRRPPQKFSAPNVSTQPLCGSRCLPRTHPSGCRDGVDAARGVDGLMAAASELVERVNLRRTPSTNGRRTATNYRAPAASLESERASWLRVIVLPTEARSDSSDAAGARKLVGVRRPFVDGVRRRLT